MMYSRICKQVYYVYYIILLLLNYIIVILYYYYIIWRIQANTWSIFMHVLHRYIMHIISFSIILKNLLKPFLLFRHMWIVKETYFSFLSYWTKYDCPNNLIFFPKQRSIYWFQNREEKFSVRSRLIRRVTKQFISLIEIDSKVSQKKRKKLTFAWFRQVTYELC